MENKCKVCGKKLKFICPNEWTKRDEKAYNLGRKADRELRN